MLFREVEGGTLAITQTTHAWVSGQIARAWGNELTGTFAPREAMLLAAEQHDIGWLNREPEPALNADAGRPRSFLELPPETHLGEIWSRAGEMSLLTSRYAALLVSLHGTHLYNRFRGDLDAANGLAQPFLEQQDAFQATLIESLGSDPNYAAYVTPKLLRRNRRLIALWDRLSLDICRGMGEPDRIEQVPFARDDVTLTIAPVADEPYRFTLAPWPFSNLRIGLIFEGRVLSTRFTSEASLKRGLAEAPWQSVAITLIPG